MRRNRLSYWASRARNGMILLLLMSLFFSACGEKTPVESREPLPDLEDPIPYSVLGHGKIAFERVGPYPGKYEGCYVVDIDSKQIWKEEIEFSANYCLSPDGKRIAYTRFSDYSLYDVHFSDFNFANEQRASQESGQDRFPSWSPDGKSIYFWVEGGNIAPQLFVQTIATPWERPKLVITFLFGLYIIPPSGRITASPEGKLAFVTNVNRAVNLAGLYILDSDGSHLKKIFSLPEGRYFESPVFSPDGKKIALLSVARDSSGAYKTMDILTVDPATGHSTLVLSLNPAGSKEWAAPGKYNDVTLVWSPSGDKLLFNLPEGDFVSHLFVVNSDGTGLTQVTFAEGVTDRRPSWSN